MERRGPANSLRDADRLLIETWEGDARAAQRGLREALATPPAFAPGRATQALAWDAAEQAVSERPTGTTCASVTTCAWQPTAEQRWVAHIARTASHRGRGPGVFRVAPAAEAGSGL